MKQKHRREMRIADCGLRIAGPRRPKMASALRQPRSALLLALAFCLCAAGWAAAANNAPIADDDSATATENNTLVIINALANDSDPDGDDIEFVSLDTTGTEGSVTHAGNGVFHYNPFDAYQRLKTGQTATDRFKYTIQDTNSATATGTVTITITGINDAPDIRGIVATPQVVGDNATIQPFSGASIVDPDQPVQSVRVLIVLDDFRPGTFTGVGVAAGGFVQGGLGSENQWTLDNVTPAVATTTLKSLIYSPVPNRQPVGQSNDVRFTVTATTVNSTDALSDTDNNTVVRIQSINDAPVIARTVLGAQLVFNGGSIRPFSTVELTDVDKGAASDGGQGISVGITVSGDLNGSLVVGTTDFTRAGNVYTLSARSQGEATRQLQALVYQAQVATLATPVNTAFAISVSDSFPPAVQDTNTVVRTATPFVTPYITGAEVEQTVGDNMPILPFARVGLQGSGSKVQIRLFQGSDLSAGADIYGQLINLNGFGKAPAGTNFVYTFTGTLEEATTRIRQVAFRPFENLLSQRTKVVFEIRLLNASDVEIGRDTRTTVDVLPVNDLPVILGAEPASGITDQQTVRPFLTRTTPAPALVRVMDLDESGQQLLAVTVELDLSSKGAFTTNSLGGITNAGPGIYMGLGTPSQVSAALQALVFKPTPNRLPAGQSETVRFRITLDDQQGQGPVINEVTTVVVTSINDPPQILLNGPDQVTADVGAGDIKPFLAASIVDADAGEQALTVTILVDNPAKGSFASLGGFTNLPTYTFIGTATEATASLRNLIFNPNRGFGSLSGAANKTVTFNVTARDPRHGLATTNLLVYLIGHNRTWLVATINDGGPGSLRQAVADAASNDSIAFNLTNDLPVILRVTSEIVLDKNLTIYGPGADKLAVSGDADGNGTPDGRIFRVANEAQVAVSGLALTRGHHDFAGGAVSVGENCALRMSYCAITHSTAGLWGGGIDVDRGALSLANCLVYSNANHAALGQAGGGVSLYTDWECSFENTTFSANHQMAVDGFGGGGLYIENLAIGMEFPISITSCTFKDNTDASGIATAIHVNGFNALAYMRNTIVADDQGINLEVDGGALILSDGGNLSDDDTVTVFSQGGAPVDVILFDHASDRRGTDPLLGTLARNGGPTATHALLPGSPALGTAFGNALATDQRGSYRDGVADVGAFETGEFHRVVISEILFNVSGGLSGQFIEFYNPRDSQTTSLTGFTVWIDGTLRHTFSPVTLPPGVGVVLAASPGVTSAAGVFRQNASTGGLNLDTNTSSIILLDTLGREVLAVTYNGVFAPADLPLLDESITLSPEFLSWSFVPHSLAPDSAGVPFSPGTDTAGQPLSPGNAPPRAFADLASTDEDHALNVSVLANDVELDRNDVIRVVEVTAASAAGAVVTINHSPRAGASVNYDPRIAPALQALPVGAQMADTFTYRIIDCCDPLFGTDWAATGIRYTNLVTVTVAGVNDLPTPQQDTTNTMENVLVDILGDQLLDNDSDPDSDDDKTTLLISAVHTTAVQENTSQTTSALGAAVQLEVRFNRHETHIIYDPSGSAILNALAVGESITDTFYYSVIDRHGAVGSAAVSVTVHGTNDGPTAGADVVRTDEDTPVTLPASFFLGNDADPDTTDLLNLTPASLTSTLGASVSITLGGIAYDPTVSSNLNALARKEIAVDTFTYTTIDGEGGMSSAVVSVMVTGVNDQPIAVADTGVTDEDTLLSVAAPGLLANDIDLDRNGLAKDDPLRVLAFSDVTTLRGAKATANGNGSFSFDPRGVFDYLKVGQVTNDSFTYTIVDDSLTIANDDQFSVLGDTANHTLRVLANDITLTGTGGTLGIIGLIAPDRGGAVSVNAARTVVFYTPAINFIGVESFSYTMADGQGGVDTALVTVRVTRAELNGNLVANPDTFTVARGTTVHLDVLANDNILPNSLAGFTLVELGATDQGGVVAVNTSGALPALTYTPDLNTVNAFPYFETFIYVLSGGGTARATGSVRVKVLDRRNALTANDDLFSVMANGGTNTLDVLANDKVLPGAGTNIIIVPTAATGAAGSVAVNAARNRLLYKPPAGILSGTDSFSYVVTDGGGGTATGRVQVVFAQSGFYANADIVTVAKSSRSNVLAVLRNDTVLPNLGQDLIVTVIGLGTNAPDHGGTVSIHSNGKTLFYTPSTNFVGEESFTYEISHGTLARAEGKVTVKVIDRAGAVNANEDVYAVSRDSRSNVLAVLQNDNVLPKAEETPTITSAGPGSQGGTILVNRAGPVHSLLYTPRPGFVGEETFSYQVADARGGTGLASVKVQVGYFTLQADNFSALSGSSSNELDVLANDNLFPDLNSIRAIMAVGLPDQGGAVAMNAARDRLLYTPQTGFAGTETFTYTMTNDSGGATVALVGVKVFPAGSDRHTATVSMTVNGVNDPPVISGTTGTQAITDKETVRPFPDVTITEVDDHGLEPLTVRVTLNAARGFLTVLSGFTQAGPGEYIFMGTAAEATVALRALVYDPIENRIIVPTSETTIFTISVDDGYVSQPVTDSTTSVVVTAVNDPPIISGTVSNQTVYHRLTLRPFTQVTITEVDDLTLQRLRIRVSLDATHGYLASLGGFVLSGSGIYSLSNVTAAAASTALRGLIFVPTTANRVGAGASETTRFTILVDDGFAPTVSDNVTTVKALNGFTRKLLASDGSSDDEFGYSVATSRDLMVVGVPFDDSHGSKSGSIYLFARNHGGPDNWGEFKKIVAFDAAAGDRFGYSVAISGGTIIVGAPRDAHNGIGSGSAYIFDGDQGGPDQWGLVRKIVATDRASGDEFGYAVTISGDTVAVGAPQDDHSGDTDPGSAYVFQRNQGGTNNWGEVRKVIGTDPDDDDEFGIAVAVSGNTLVVGVHRDNDRGGDSGSVYVFGRDQTGANQWGQVRKLLASDADDNDHFGRSVAISGDMILVGAPSYSDDDDEGAAYVFVRDEGGVNRWGQARMLVAADADDDDEFGFSVAIDGEILVIGSRHDDDNGSKSGSVYVYVRNHPGLTQWALVEKIVPHNGEKYAEFGYAVAISQHTVAVGARLDDDAGDRFGSTYVYRLKFNNAPLQVNLIPNQSASTNLPFLFLLPANTFGDADIGDAWTLSAALSDGSALPVWLSFSSATGIFSGTPVSEAIYTILVTAIDKEGATVTATFQLSVNEDGTDANGAPPPLPILLSIVEDVAGGRVLLSYRRLSVSGFTYSLETSSDLAAWTSGDSLVQSELIGQIDGVIEEVTWSLDKLSLTGMPQFFRIKCLGH